MLIRMIANSEWDDSEKADKLYRITGGITSGDGRRAIYIDPLSDNEALEYSVDEDFQRNLIASVIEHGVRNGSAYMTIAQDIINALQET